MIELLKANDPVLISFVQATLAYLLIGLALILTPPCRRVIFREDARLALLETRGEISRAKSISFSFTVVALISLIWPALVCYHLFLVTRNERKD